MLESDAALPASDVASAAEPACDVSRVGSQRRRWGGGAVTPASDVDAAPGTAVAQRGRRWGQRAATVDVVVEAAAAAGGGELPEAGGGEERIEKDEEAQNKEGGAEEDASKKTEAVVLARKFHEEILASNVAVKALSFELAAAGLRFAEELFRPRSQELSFEKRRDISLLGETSCVQTTWKLRRDFERIAEGNALYWPECMCGNDDLTLFNALHEELSPWLASPYRRSRHPACVEETLLLQSPTYRRLAAILCKTFDFHIGYSIVNLYSNGNDWTEYHRDNYKAEGNRMTMTAAEAAIPPTPHNATIGASFGAPRELRFKHLQTGLEFGFPQGNGDVFAFTEPVNSAFQHSIPQCAPNSAGRRISIILWGRTGRPGALLPPGHASKRR